MSTDHSALFEDLLKDTGADARANDPRYAIGVDVAAARRAQVMIPSIDRAKAILLDVVGQRMPKAEEIERMARAGKHVEPVTRQPRNGHRRRVEQGTLEMDSVVGKIPESQFVFNLVVGILDTSNLSSFYGRLQRDEQPNGQWVPVYVRAWEDRRVTRNGRQALTVDMQRKMPDFPRSNMSEGDVVAEWIGEPPEVVSEVGEVVLMYQIVWMDTLNAEDMPARDWAGKPMSNTTVIVDNNGMTEGIAALTKAANAIAGKVEAPAPVVAEPPDVAALRAELAAAKARAEAAESAVAVLTEKPAARAKKE